MSTTLTFGTPPTRTIYMVAEEIGEATDEGYAKVVVELGRAMGRHSTVLTHVTRGTDGDRGSRIYTALRRMRAVMTRELRAEMKRARPSTVVYMSRSSATLTALARSRVLKWIGGGAPIVMVALQPRRLGWPGRLASRMMWPDLLLVSTDEELRGARGRGANVDRMVTGVDLERFRPARPGEKSELRKKWGIPGDSSVVLHVGHLTEGRNLEALLPFAAQAGTTMVFVASSRRQSSSAALEQRLRTNGVVVIQGFLPDIDEIYRLADCYVFPTMSTDFAIGMPLSVLEAMASDLPVAAMRFGALPERFDSADGVTLVESPDRLIEAVTRLLREPRSTRKQSEQYSWDAVAEQVAGAWS